MVLAIEGCWYYPREERVDSLQQFDVQCPDVGVEMPRRTCHVGWLEINSGALVNLGSCEW